MQSDSTSSLKSDGKTYTASTSYDYGTGNGYALGAVTFQSTSSWVSGSGGGSSWSNVTNGYLWYDGALQSTISQANGGAGGNTNWSTSLSYDGLGRLASAYIADGKPRLVSYVNDELGQIIRRDESGVTGQTGAPHEVWYRYGGRQLGYTGNNGTSDLGTAASIDDRRTAAPASNQGTFRNRQLYGGAYADFAQSYDPLNSYGQGSAPGSGGGSYTVQRGDTLQGIAQAMWGDANLWYKIAEANGLGAGAALIEGQRLTLPTGVVRTAHNADSFRPYDPANAIGDLTPGTAAQAKKAKSNKCGAFGAILLAVVAVAVTVVTAGAAVAAVAALGPAGTSLASGISTVLGTSLFGGTVLGSVAGVVGTGGAIALGAASAALGSIASQSLGVATGIQDKFNWTGVTLAAIGGGVGGALGPGGLAGGEKGLFSGIGNATAAIGLRAATSSALSQVVGLVTGLQSKFSWAGIAAAGVGAAAGMAAGGNSDGFGNFAASSAATLVANAATRSALEGSSFGDNILAALPDTLATILFRAIGKAANGVQQSSPRDNGSPASIRRISARDSLAEIVSRFPGGGQLIDASEVKFVNEQALTIADVDRIEARSSDQIKANRSLTQGERDRALTKLANKSAYARQILFSQASGAANSTANSAVQSTLDSISGTIQSGINSVVDQYQAGCDLQQRMSIGTSYDLGADFVVGAVSTVAETLPGIISVVSHPQQAMLGLAGAIDRVFLDDTPARVHLVNAYQSFRSSTPRQIAFGSGRIAGNFVPIGIPAKIGSLRAASFDARVLAGATERTGVDLALKYKPGWSATQQADALAKTQILSDADTVVLQMTRGGTSARTMFKRAGGEVPAGNDVDHMVDLQLGGSDTIGNMWPLDSSVNRSLGAQIQQQIKNMPAGTRINRVTIGHR